MTIAVTIDEMQIPSVVGTLAGDDLVLVMIERREDRTAVKERLGRLFREKK